MTGHLAFAELGSFATRTNALNQNNALEEGQQYPGCPPPVLPEVAFFLAPYANLELTLTAGPDGTVKKVVISKRSRARIYDEYTRKWVAEHWKMPPAKPGEPEERKFIAPIVYPKPHKISGGRFPQPEYPYQFLHNHIEGFVIIDITVAPSGKVESARTLLSSGHKELDDYTGSWVKSKWKFPPGEKRNYWWPVTYMLQ